MHELDVWQNDDEDLDALGGGHLDSPSTVLSSLSGATSTGEREDATDEKASVSTPPSPASPNVIPNVPGIRSPKNNEVFLVFSCSYELRDS